MSLKARGRGRRATDVRSHVHCALSFAAQSLPISSGSAPACDPYKPQHAPSETKSFQLRLRPASANSSDLPAAKLVPAGTLVAMPPPEASAARGDTGGRPTKRPRLCAGPQPLPPRRLPDPGCVRLLLQAACVPFDISLESALQQVAQAARITGSDIDVSHAPSKATAAAASSDAGEAAAIGPLPARTLLPPPLPLLPIFPSPHSGPPTQKQVRKAQLPPGSQLCCCRAAKFSG